MGQRLAASSGALITVLHVVPPRRASGDSTMDVKTEIDRVFPPTAQVPPVEFRIVEDESPVDAVLRACDDIDLVVVGLGGGWGLGSQYVGLRHQRIAMECAKSILIVRKFARGVAAKPTPA
jgi:nucleotide-binding universal stress UspA family protein